MAEKRIYVPVSDENHEKITKISNNSDGKKIARVAAELLVVGLNQSDKETTLSYQQEIANKMVKK